MIPALRIHSFLLLLAICTTASPAGVLNAQESGINPECTFTNPINIGYPFWSYGETTWRSMADPNLIRYGDEYFLFATGNAGYWYTADFITWTHVWPKGLPDNFEAPGAGVLNERIYASANFADLYTTDDPKSGVWERVSDSANEGDPAFFQDDDGRVFLFYGLSLNGPISGVELDPDNNYERIREPFHAFSTDFESRGWEQAGDEHLGGVLDGALLYAPWIEAPWMTKHDGTYYLQYSAPGTQFKTYAHGVYTASAPEGPYVYSEHNPISYMPTGFIGGAGHGSVFRDRLGNYWQIATMIVSVKHKFERRLGLFPLEFDDDGVMRVHTYMADLPQYLPDCNDDGRQGLVGWMLLSHAKSASASSTLPPFETTFAFDEDVRTHWSAASGAPGEWLQVDLGSPHDVHAVQVNFAEEGLTAPVDEPERFYRYTIDISNDGVDWTTIVDQSQNQRDTPHDYVALDEAARGRYLRLINFHVPAPGKFSIRDFRVFGKGLGEAPPAVETVQARRDEVDPRRVVVTWESADSAEGYVVRFGAAPDKLYQSYQVRGTTTAVINSLNSATDYYFTVDAFNANGITRGESTATSPSGN